MSRKLARRSLRLPLALGLSALAIFAASRPAAAACISLTNTKGQYGVRKIFDVGGSNFGSSLKVYGGLWNYADAKADAEETVAIMRMLGIVMPMPYIPSDRVEVFGEATGKLRFFGETLELLQLLAKAERSEGTYKKKFTIEVAGIDLYSGTNNLTETTKTITYSAPFYTVGTRYSGVYAEGKILGEIGLAARAHAASDGLLVDGKAWAALVLHGSAGVSVGVAGVGLFAKVDLLEVDDTFKNSTGLTANAPYDFYNTYGASTLDGSVALKASALGGSTTLWSDSWNGSPIATKVLYDINGCVN